jgi:hypothetical protein
MKRGFVPDRDADPAVVAADAAAHVCANCGATAPDRYCPACGQDTRDRLPTFVQFMREATGRYLSFDGKLWKTLLPLLFHPGFLTRAYLVGKRKRFIGPARLFLISSLVLFAVLRFTVESMDIVELDHAISSGPSDSPKSAKSAAKADTKVDGKGTVKSAAGAKAKVDATAAAKSDAKADTIASTITDAIAEAKSEMKHAPDKQVVVSDDLDFSMIDLGDSIGGPLKKRIDRFNKLPRDEKIEQVIAGTSRYGPYAMFVLLPAFAALLKLAYLGRRRRYPGRPRLYGEHLVFAAHNHAFLFTVLILVFAVPVSIVRNLLAIWIFVYLAWSTHAVYGGSWLGIAVRGFALLIVYFVLFVLVTVGLLIAAVLLR